MVGVAVCCGVAVGVIVGVGEGLGEEEGLASCVYATTLPIMMTRTTIAAMII
jgi:hypothetical protein